MTGTNPGGFAAECLRVGGRRRWSNRSRDNNQHGCCTCQSHQFEIRKTRRNLLQCRHDDADTFQGIVSHVVTESSVYQVLEAWSRAGLISHVLLHCI